MKTKSVLIIDDDLELCEELVELLRDQGYYVESSSDSSKAELLIKGRGFDAVVLDYKMSGLNGIDILKKVRGEDLKKKFVIISGRPFIKELLETEKLSEMVSGIVTKPIDFALLLEKIESTT